MFISGFLLGCYCLIPLNHSSWTFKILLIMKYELVVGDPLHGVGSEMSNFLVNNIYHMARNTTVSYPNQKKGMVKIKGDDMSACFCSIKICYCRF